MLNWLPENISTLGEGIDQLFSLIYYITVAIFALVYVVYLIFIVKYRRKRKGEKAYYTHGNNLLEFTWTLLPFALFAFLAFYSDIIWRDLKYPSHKPNPDLEIELMGQQFMWHFRYPGSDGIFGRRDQMLISTTNPFGLDPDDPNGKDDLIVPNRLHVPMNKTILLRMSSMDVLHSFFVPHLRIKQDLIPGQWVDVWFDARKTGEYEIACAELCGRGHYLMRGVMDVYAQTDFDSWIDQQYQKVAAALQATTETVDATPSKGGWNN